jgi:hypothetical protein
MNKCYICAYQGKIIGETEFYSEEAKYASKPLGVMWVISAFQAEIYENYTSHWECSYCWWQGWWDI